MDEVRHKSVDGISPAPSKHEVYVARRRQTTQHEPFLSIQPKPIQKRFQDVSPKRVRDAFAKARLSRTAVSRVVKPGFRSKEVVVNVSKKWSIRASLNLVLQYLLIAVLAVLAAYSTSIGQWFVLAYGIYAIITRQDSRLTYGIALFILVAVPFFQAINQPGVANNMAVYVFELLLLGTVQALIELKWPKKVDPVA